MDKDILMPINPKFLEVFEIFMDENQKEKIRANNVRQYMEGVIDLLLKDRILPELTEKEKYEGLNWKRKLNILEKNYDENITKNIREIFAIGGQGSHFNGSVERDELQAIINKAIHIVEDIFVKYFLSPEHRFGSENIFTIFSMLPLKPRIYILENIITHYINWDVVDRLSLAYTKNGEYSKAVDLLKKYLQKGEICEKQYEYQISKLKVLITNLENVQEINNNDNFNEIYGVIDHNMVVIGKPSAKNIFQTANIIKKCKPIFDDTKDQYPEFLNLFFFLMQTDDRKYE